MRNTELASEVGEKRVLATVESALLKALKEQAVSVSSKLAASPMENANSRWSFYRVARRATKVEKDASNAFIAVSG